MSQQTIPKPTHKAPSTKGLRKFEIPSGVYTQHTAKLNRELLKIYRRVRRKTITKDQAKAQGAKVLRDHRDKMRATAKKWFGRNGLKPVEPETRIDTDDVLDEKIRQWNKIVDDM